MKKSITKFPLTLDIQTFAGNPNEALFWEVMSATSIATVVEEAPSIGDPYMGDSLFPNVKVDGLSLSYIKDSKGIPIVLKPSQFDVATPIRDRNAIKVESHEMPYFKEGMILGERERQDLFNAFSRGNQAYQQILTRIYDDRLTLVEAAKAQVERLRFQALTTGKIKVTANGEYLEYDFGLPADQLHTVASADEWNKPTADVLKTVKLAKKTIRDKTGASLKYVLMNESTLDNLLNNNQFKSIINPLAQNAGNIPILLESAFTQAFTTYTGLTIVTYNKMYRDEEGVMHAYLTDGVVVFIPEGKLGNTNYGTTPQEFDLLNSTDHSANVAIVETGVAITSFKEVDPVNSKTVVSQIVMPSYEQIDNTFVANVYTP